MPVELLNMLYGLVGVSFGVLAGPHLVTVVRGVFILADGLISGWMVSPFELELEMEKRQGRIAPLVPVEQKPQMEAELAEQVESKPSDYRLDKQTSRLLASLAKALLVAEKNGLANGRGEEFRRAQTLRKRLLDNVDAWRETVDYEGRNSTNYAVFLSNLGLIAKQLAEHNRNYKRAGSRQLRTLNSYLAKKVEDSTVETVA